VPHEALSQRRDPICGSELFVYDVESKKSPAAVDVPRRQGRRRTPWWATMSTARAGQSLVRNCLYLIATNRARTSLKWSLPTAGNRKCRVIVHEEWLPAGSHSPN